MSIELENINNSSEKGGDTPASSFPTIVTDSGSSLPATTGYLLNDTFLNTSDKKIYKTLADTYEWNTGVTHGAVTIDFTTGIVTNISTGQTDRSLYRTFSENVWAGNKNYQIKFKVNTFTTSENHYIPLITFYYGSSTSYYRCFGIDSNQKIVYCEARTAYGSVTAEKFVTCLDTVLELNKEYTLVINKTGTSCTTSLLESGVEKEIKSFDGVTNLTNSTGIRLGYGYFTTGSYTYQNLGTEADFYLLDTSGDFLIPASELVWDSGVAIEDKSEIADKTNGILYLYENDELVNIPQNKIFTDVYVNNWVADSTYADYGYKCEITNLNGVTANMFAQVIFAPAQADSGNYATVCLTGNGTVTIYSKVNDTISIPSIVVMGV